MRNNYNNVTSFKRQNVIRNYENIKIKTTEKEKSKKGYARYSFEVNFGEHKGFYRAKQIAEFEECQVTERVVLQRLLKLNSKVGSFETIKDAIISPPDERTKRNNHDLLKERLTAKQTEIEWFNENIKLMKPGSLHKKYRIMQSYQIK